MFTGFPETYWWQEQPAPTEKQIKFVETIAYRLNIDFPQSSRDFTKYAYAKFIKEKCTREEALQMQEIAWWDWGQETIENRVEDFKLSYKDFISKYAK